MPVLPEIFKMPKIDILQQNIEKSEMINNLGKKIKIKINEAKYLKVQEQMLKETDPLKKMEIYQEYLLKVRMGDDEDEK